MSPCRTLFNYFMFCNRIIDQSKSLSSSEVNRQYSISKRKVNDLNNNMTYHRRIERSEIIATKKNKIPRNKPNQGCKRTVLRKL